MLLPTQQKRPGRAGAFNRATKALRALDYLPLEAGAADSAFFAWWCFLAWCFLA